MGEHPAMPSTTEKTRVGFAGLGIMGARMARRYLDAGHPLTVWTRTVARAEPLRAAGASVASDPAALARASDVICLNLADPPAVLGTLAAMEPGLRAGQTVIDFSTVAPATSLEAEARLARRGVGYLEAPVTGSKGGAAEGKLLIMAAGDKALLDRMQPVLAVVSRQTIHCGPTGAGSQVKLIGNSLIAHMVVAMAQGIAVAREAGIDWKVLLEVVQASGFSSPYWAFKGGAMAARDWETHFTLDLLHKDLLLLLDGAAASRVPLPGVAMALELVQAARARGWGGEDIAAIAKLFDVTPRAP
jgi:3-hydroxyisobutyrate dehydrogenase-like beta-hydroxyacid dehydrogenase